MAKKNITYTILVIAALLLILIPFFIFDLDSSVGGYHHFTRIGLHLLAFAGALFAGSLVSGGVVQSGVVSLATTKVATAVAVVAVGTAVTYNLTANTPLTAKLSSIVRSDTTSVVTQIDYSQITSLTDSLSAETFQDSVNLLDNQEVTDVSSNASTQDASTETQTIATPKIGGSTPTPIGSDTKTTIEESAKKEISTIKTLKEICNNFTIFHGSKALDHKLGLSVYDPNKTMLFNNDCGCILKNANISLSRGNTILEEKKQNGNFIRLNIFKDLQADDRFTVEIRQASCKDETGTTVEYTFPKPILKVILISDHREFETNTQNTPNKKKPKALDNSSDEPVIKKDKIEEEVNKYGN